MRTIPSPSRSSLHRSVRLFFGGHNRAIVDFFLREFRYRTSVFNLRIVQVPPSNGLSSACRSCRALMSQDLSSKTPPPLTSHVAIGMLITDSSAQTKAIAQPTNLRKERTRVRRADRELPDLACRRRSRLPPSSASTVRAAEGLPVLARAVAGDGARVRLPSR